jgi:hypothetical protein
MRKDLVVVVVVVIVVTERTTPTERYGSTRVGGNHRAPQWSTLHGCFVVSN